MGGRKSQELSHINYTEILKQCLAAVGVFNLIGTLGYLATVGDVNLARLQLTF